VIEVAVPELVGAEHATWHVVLDLAAAHLPRWMLAGGLMVHLHMSLDPPNTDGRGHRFTRDDGAMVEVLAADVGERSRPHTTIPPARTVEVPGGRGLLTGAEQVRLICDGRAGTVIWSSTRWHSCSTRSPRSPDGRSRTGNQK